MKWICSLFSAVGIQPLNVRWLCGAYQIHNVGGPEPPLT
jgi:hypothetical protein